jgi:hypothetical protein
MRHLDEPAGVDADAAVEWLHETVLRFDPPHAFARAFAQHHLLEHRLFHLVDVVRVVAGELAAQPVVGRLGLVRMMLAKYGPLVVLRVVAGSTTITDPPHAGRDAGCGSGAVGLLSLEWGVSVGDDGISGLWATFDTERHQHAVRDVGAALNVLEAPPLLAQRRSRTA